MSDATDPSANADAPDGATDPSADAPDAPLQVLLRVQDLDLAMTRLERRRVTLPERTDLEAAGERLAEVAARSRSLEEERRALAERQSEIEDQVVSINARRQAIEQRMYGARGAPPRDLQAMDEEVHHLATRRAEREDVELEVMEELEPVDAALSVALVDAERLGAEVASLQAALGEAEAVIDAELASVTSARAAEAKALPTALADRYETLRARLGGIGAARLVGNRCTGCHLELPAKEAERIRRLPPGTVVTCDQCGRIVVPSVETGAGPRPPR